MRLRGALLACVWACGDAGTDAPGGPPQQPDLPGVGTETDGGPPDDTLPDDTDRAADVPPIPAPVVDPDAVPSVLVRRLTVWELDNVLRDVLGRNDRPAARWLQAELAVPFDNDVAVQEPSADLVLGLEGLAAEVTAGVLADPDTLGRVTGCAGRGDTACLRDGVARLGRLLLRRPLATAEVDDLLALTSGRGGFPGAMEPVLLTLLQDAAFLYRVEVGREHPDHTDLRVLDAWEVASRLSFLVWGSAPDHRLLSAAEAGELGDPAARADEARRLAADPRAAGAVQRFHGQWLAYDVGLNTPDRMALVAQADEMVAKVLLQDIAPWQQLLRTPDAWLSPSLAEHYGLSNPGRTGWVPAPDPERRGLLSWGAFLGAGPRGIDTSPTLRGKLVLERLLCQPIGAPPAGVAADAPPPSPDPDACKPDRYEAHRTDPGCNNCHRLLDGIGFGLEAYDLLGRVRQYETSFRALGESLNLQCPVTTAGVLPDGTPFSGPAELSEGVADEAAACLVQHAVAWSSGTANPGRGAITAIRDRWDPTTGTFPDLLAAIASDPTFVVRREVSP